MTNKTIVFTAPNTAEFLEEELLPPKDDEVLVRTEYSVVSAGTERANLLGMQNTGKSYPRFPGYSAIGTVMETGPAVNDLSAGDRVLVYHGRHALYNKVRREKITKVDDPVIDSRDAVFTIIASMGLGGVRKLDLEIGESCLVMGLGLLGLFSVEFARLNGGYPVIAADLNPERRELALKLGADYALNPADAEFSARVKELTKGKGVNAVVEVTGVAAALKQALSCTARLGRVSLLGCTRVSDCAIDFYNEVHKPGITLIGAHNFFPRPKVDSRPHCWTHQDDCKAILDLVGAGRIEIRPILSRTVEPAKAPEIYRELAEDPLFPVGTVFDWRNLL